MPNVFPNGSFSSVPNWATSPGRVHAISAPLDAAAIPVVNSCSGIFTLCKSEAADLKMTR
ncbi:MAG: hypothetical protein C0191_02935 [Mucilaginibacter sp.]|nr:MAG: hypothetical protein C0191_02935 [Mucilaginibacter sp.]